jgi:phosphoglucomutase
LGDENTQSFHAEITVGDDTRYYSSEAMKSRVGTFAEILKAAEAAKTK